MERMVQADRPAILIVERDEVVRELQKFFLERAGYDIEFVADGESALERARECPPAVVVTEILVPKIDGLALCRRLGEDPLTRGVPVVVFSMLAAASRATEAGARSFVRKPLVESIFVAAIRDVLVAAHAIQLENR
jgi:CheY-like chemotaxis protein